MKPILLEMTAFGSYAEKTTVDFDRLTHGLYLITGDPGAGKTTIFDAIMFALYGTASGPDRIPEMMHCDFVDKTVDTRVALKFRQSGRNYAVTRTIHYPKKRGVEGQFRDGVLDAVLEEPDRQPTEGAKKVTDRCAELLGLNAEQFRKIVMLAQGEFKEFLDADGEKKNDILGKLFDNSAYVRYQELLKGARDALRAERDAHSKRVEETMQTVFLPPDNLEETERELYLPGHPELVRNLSALTEADELRLKDLSNQRDVCREQERALMERKGAAEGQNHLLNELNGQKARLADLERQAEDMALRQSDCDAVEKALHQIQPKRELLAGAEQALRRTNDEIAGLQEFLHGVQKFVVEQAEAAVQQDADVKQEIDELKHRIQKLDETLPQYEELDKKCKSKQAAEDRAKEAEEQKDKAQSQIKLEKKALEELGKEEADLADIDAQVVKLAHDYREAQENTEALAGKNGLQAHVECVTQSERELARRQAELKELAKEASAAEQRHHTLYQAFIGGQAGLLAEKLRQDLAVNGSAVCPVCHSEFHAGHGSTFAPLPNATPTQAAVDAAKRDYEEKEQKRSEQDTNTAALRSSIDTAKDSVLREAQRLLPDCVDWDTLVSEGYLARQIARFRQVGADGKRALDEAKQKQRRRQELSQQRTEGEARLEELNAAISRLEEEHRAHQLSIGKLDAAISELQKQLQYPDKNAAKEQIRSRKKRLDDLAKQVKRHQDDLDAAKQTWDTTSGSLTGLKNQLPAQEQAKTEAETALQAALAQNGFPSLEDVDRTLLLTGGRDGEAWLRAQKNVLVKYQSDMKSTGERVEALNRQTAGLSYVDLTELQEQIRQAAESYNTANAAYSKQEKLRENHRAVAETVAHARTALAKSEQAWNRQDLLANLAVGVSGDGGKLSFDRYVMGTAFREILEMANRRLILMSGGKYELIHQLSTDRRNAKAGLEVEVLDMATGKQRNSKSLSGGESFLVSLSLALGLSDVVQNHAGGRKLDALFIDEGFGSLDSNTLDVALDVLNQLTEGSCLVGVISHVSKLEESIPQRIRVKNSDRGSSLQFE